MKQRLIIIFFISLSYFVVGKWYSYKGWYNTLHKMVHFEQSIRASCCCVEHHRRTQQIPPFSLTTQQPSWVSLSQLHARSISTLFSFTAQQRWVFFVSCSNYLAPHTLVSSMHWIKTSLEHNPLMENLYSKIDLVIITPILKIKVKGDTNMTITINQ